MRKAFIIISFLFTSYTAMCSHIVGGELYFDCLGNNQYLITLKLYRNCSDTCTHCAPYGNPEYIAIFDSSGNLVSQDPMPFPGADTLSPTFSNPCLTPIDICTELAVYTTTVTLPPKAGGYDVVYQRCCRTDALLNLVEFQGASYVAHIPDPSLATCDNSPRFNLLPPMYMCLDAPLALDYSATDPDGDSLVYSMCNPISGATNLCPDPAPNGGGGGCPTVPGPPPYNPNQFVSPYSVANFTNNPAVNDLTINPQTGLLTGTPNQPGIFDVTVCVSEYRNGKFLGTVSRDYQFTIAQCNIPIAAVPEIGVTGTGEGIYVINCKNYTVNFVNNTFNPGGGVISYAWDFGVPGSTTDTSSQFSPSYTYPDSGAYKVQLVAILTENGASCYDTTTALVYVYPTFTTNFSAPNECQNEAVQFTDSTVSSYGVINRWLWNFGDGNSANIRDPSHHYSAPGTYTVTLVDQNSVGCVDTDQRTVVIYPAPSPGFTTGNTCVDATVNFTNTTTGNDSTYEWIFGDGSGISTVTNPTHLYNSAGVDTVMLIALGTNGCIDTLAQVLTIHPLPVILHTNDTTICPFDSAQLYATGGVSYLWSPAATLNDSAIATPVATPVPPNPITYTVAVTDQNGCTNRAQLTVTLYPIPNIQVTPDTSVCLNPLHYRDSVQLQALGGISYTWTPAAGLSATNISNPLAKPSVNTTYYVTGIDGDGCPLTDSVRVTVLSPFLNLILQDSVTICEGDTAHATVVDQGASNYNWVPLQYLTSPFSWNTGFFPPDTTDYILTVSNYCYVKSDSLLVIVWPSPQFNLNPLDSICTGDSIQLNAQGGDTVAWTPGTTLSDSTIFNPWASPTVATKYYVSGSNQYGCFSRDSTLILVYQPNIIQVAAVRPWYCLGDTVQLQATGANFYQWSPVGTIANPDLASTSAKPLDTTTYYVIGTNLHGCKTLDSILVNVQLPITFTAPDLYQVCRGTPVQLLANGGLYYEWWPDSTLKNPLTNDPFANPDSTTLYSVRIANDCFADTANVDVVIHQLPSVEAGPDTTIWRGTDAYLHGTSSVSNYFWEPSTWLQSAFDLNTSAAPPQTTWYYLFAIDTLGCINHDSVLITVIPYVVLDIPTGFSPNGDGMNDVFRIVKYLDIAHLNEFAVFDRWGEKVFSTDNIAEGWDGDFRGKPAPVGVYVWTLTATTEEGEEIARKGNVTLIR